MATTSTSTTPALTLKIELEGEVRRLRGWPQDGAEPSLQSLRDAISQLFGLQSVASLSIKYRDDEDDLCSLIDATLPDALEIAKAQKNTLRLLCFISNERVDSKLEEYEVVDSVDTSLPVSVAEETGTDAIVEADNAANDEVGGHSANPQPRLPLSLSLSLPLPLPLPLPLSLSLVPSTEAQDGTSSAQETAAERLEEACCKVAEHLERAKPQLIEGLSHFKQQVVTDFNYAHEDMKCAFDASSTSSVVGRADQPPTIRQISNVAAAAAGIAVAGRLLPVRAARLAAHGVAAVVKAGDDTSNAEVVAPSSDSPPNAREGSANFKEHVVRDFETAREEINAAFGYLLGNPEVATGEESAAEAAIVNLHNNFRQVVPLVASTVAGCTVAASLAPLRAARVAVATAATHMNATTTTASSTVIPEVAVPVPAVDAAVESSEQAVEMPPEEVQQ